jgi:hypothetical protein
MLCGGTYKEDQPAGVAQRLAYMVAPPFRCARSLACHTYRRLVFSRERDCVPAVEPLRRRAIGYARMLWTGLDLALVDPLTVSIRRYLSCAGECRGLGCERLELLRGR